MSAPGLPRVEIFIHDEGSHLALAPLRSRIGKALPLCLAAPGSGDAVLTELEEVEINLVSDETIAKVHADFMDDPTPTDVITFQHGEIFVSCETARREGPDHGHGEVEEILLYMIHGLLHLNGHTDAEDPERALMHRTQDAVLKSVLAQGDPGV